MTNIIDVGSLPNAFQPAAVRFIQLREVPPAVFTGAIRQTQQAPRLRPDGRHELRYDLPDLSHGYLFDDSSDSDY